MARQRRVGGVIPACNCEQCPPRPPPVIAAHPPLQSEPLQSQALQALHLGVRPAQAGRPCHAQCHQSRMRPWRRRNRNPAPNRRADVDGGFLHRLAEDADAARAGSPASWAARGVCVPRLRCAVALALARTPPSSAAPMPPPRLCCAKTGRTRERRGHYGAVHAVFAKKRKCAALLPDPPHFPEGQMGRWPATGGSEGFF